MTEQEGSNKNNADRLFLRIKAALEPDYIVERELARGGMGVVFLARDPSLDKKVAVKVLSPQFITRKASARFISEARILAGISHRNVVTVHRAGEADGLSYFIMDYIEGGTLADQIANGPLAIDEVVNIGLGLLDALETVHAKDVIHRDIKPANIFMIGNRALLADFGIHKPPSASDGTKTAPGTPIGTPLYMSPEVLAGFKAKPQSDFYSVGMVLYEALTGRIWQTGQSCDDADWSGVPGSLRRILTGALRLVPDERWPDAQTFKNLLSSARPKPFGQTLLRIARTLAVGLVFTTVIYFAVKKNAQTANLEEVPVALRPSNSAARGALARGEAFRRQARWADAITAFHAAFAADSSCIWCSWRIVESSRWEILPPEKTHLRKMLAGIETFPGAHRTVVNARTIQDIRSRMELLKEAVERWQDDQATFTLANEIFSRGPLGDIRRSDSRQWLEQVLRNDTDFAPAWETLAWLEIAEGNQAPAARALGNLERIDQDARERFGRADLPPDERGAPFHFLLNLGYLFRFGESERGLTILRTGPYGYANVLQHDQAAAAPRLMPSFGSARGAVELGDFYARRDEDHLRVSGLVSQVFGFFALGQIDSARVRVRALQNTEADWFGGVWAKMVTVLSIFDPEAAGPDREPWEELRGFRSDDPLGIAWMSKLELAASGATDFDPSLEGDEDNVLGRIVAGGIAAGAGNPHQALEITAELSREEIRTVVVGDSIEIINERDIFFRSTLHLFRSRWFLAAANPRAAYKALRWYENSDQHPWPVFEPLPQEIDWAFGPTAAWMKAEILEGIDGGNLAELCEAYSYVQRVWGNGDPVYRDRAERATTRFEELACETGGSSAR